MAGGSGAGFDDQEMLRMLRGQGGDAAFPTAPSTGLVAGGAPGGSTGQTPATGGGNPTPDTSSAPRTGGTAYGDPSAPGPIGVGGGTESAQPPPPTAPSHLPAQPTPTVPTAYQPDVAAGSQYTLGANPFQNPPTPQTPSAPLPPTAPPSVGETPVPGTPGGTTAPAGGAGTNWASADYSDPNTIRSYFQSQGISDPAQLDRLVNTWSTYHAQPWAKDSAYFFQRMSQENDLGGKNGGGGGSAGGGATIPSSQYETDPMVKDAIRKLLEHGQTMPSGEDPTIRAQFNPQSQVIQRDAARAKASAAERAFGQGQVGAGANDLASGQIDQASSQNEAGLMGSLIGNELQARRQEVVQALGLAQGEERNSLQQYLANIDAILRNQGLTNQNQQYYDDLGFRIGQSAK